MRPTLTLGVVAAALVIGATAAPAEAANPSVAGATATDCTDLDGEWVQGPELEFYVVSGEVAPGDVRVPPDTPCAFTGTTIRGDLIVTPDGPEPVPTVALLEGGSSVTGAVTVRAGSAVVVTESSVGTGVHCRRCDFIDAYDAVVGGNITAVRVGGAVWSNTRVHGDVRFVAGRQLTSPDAVAFIDIADSVIDGELSLVGNRGEPNSILIDSTSVGGDFRCLANDPPPTTESLNVNGRSLGQCSTQSSG